MARTFRENVRMEATLAVEYERGVKEGSIDGNRGGGNWGKPFLLLGFSGVEAHGSLTP